MANQIGDTVSKGNYFNVCTDETNQTFETKSFYTDSEDVSFADGENAENKVGAIKGITSDFNTTDAGYAASMTAVSKLNSSLESQPNFVYDSTGKITGYKTKAGADTVFPFSGGFNGAGIYMSGTNSGNLSKIELASKGQYFYGFDYDNSTKKFTVLYDGTYSYMLSTTSSYTSLYINDKLIEYANKNGQTTIYNTIELKKGDTGYISSNNAGQFAQGYLRRIA